MATLNSDQRGGWFVQEAATGLDIESGVPRAVTLGTYSTKGEALEAHPDAVLGVDENGQTTGDRQRAARFHVVQHETGSRRNDGPGRRMGAPFATRAAAEEDAAERRRASGAWYEYSVEEKWARSSW